MELKEFVSAALADIVEGVKAAQDKIEKGGALVNPVDPAATHGPLQEINFDIAVTAREAESIEGRAGLSVVGVSVGGGGQRDLENVAVSRVQFGLKVRLPATPKPPGVITFD